MDDVKYFRIEKSIVVVVEKHGEVIFTACGYKSSLQLELTSKHATVGMQINTENLEQILKIK